MDPVTSIEKVSQGLKNSSKGHINETLVSDYLEKKGWEIVCRNKRFFGVEIDLIAKKKNLHILVEVKSLNHYFILEKILNLKQKRRLQKVGSMLSEELKGDFCLFLATVNSKQKISFFQLVD